MAVRIAGVTKTYRAARAEVQALDDVSLDVGNGEFVALLGKSGCGKSTLLSMIGGLSLPSAGVIEMEGRRVSSPQTQVGFVFQQPTLLRWRTALDNVLLQAEAKGIRRESARIKAADLLRSVGLEDSSRKRPAQLSGGMQQRVSICRALLHEPRVLLMDEPFSALDEITREEMCLQLQDLWMAQAPTVIFVTHNIAEAVFLADRVVVMNGRPGRISLQLEVDFPRPRPASIREEPAFLAHVRRLREAL